MNLCSKGTTRAVAALLAALAIWICSESARASQADAKTDTDSTTVEADSDSRNSGPEEATNSSPGRPAEKSQEPKKLGRSNGDSISSLAGKKGDANRMLWQMLASVLIIAVLGAVAYFGVRRFAPKFRLTPRRDIHLMETLPLGARKSLHLVEVGGKKLLLGSCRESISILTELDDESSSQGHSRQENQDKAQLSEAKDRNARGKFASALKEQMQ
jgi:flagellar biogenesis protein FliO